MCCLKGLGTEGWGLGTEGWGLGTEGWGRGETEGLETEGLYSPYVFQS